MSEGSRYEWAGAMYLDGRAVSLKLENQIYKALCAQGDEAHEALADSSFDFDDWPTIVEDMEDASEQFPGIVLMVDEIDLDNDHWRWFAVDGKSYCTRGVVVFPSFDPGSLYRCKRYTSQEEE